jgi:hypothetical protein
MRIKLASIRTCNRTASVYLAIKTLNVVSLRISVNHGLLLASKWNDNSLALRLLACEMCLPFDNFAANLLEVGCIYGTSSIQKPRYLSVAYAG